MKNYKIKSILIFLLFIFFINCTKSDENVCKWDAMPDSLILKITKSGTIVSDLVLAEIKLSYYENNAKKYVKDFTIENVDTNIRNKGYISTRGIGTLSGNNNIKTYFIEYPNGWPTDTLYVDYLPNTPETNCRYVLNPVKINNTLADTEYSTDFYRSICLVKIP
jgi:hypothetical protein